MFNFHKNKKCSHLLFIWRRWHLASVGRARWRFLVLHHGQRGQRTHGVAIHVKAINLDSRLWRKDKSTQRERVREIVRERDKENRRRLHYLCWLSKSECSSNRNNNNNNESDSHYKCSICMSSIRGGVGGGRGSWSASLGCNSHPTPFSFSICSS